MDTSDKMGLEVSNNGDCKKLGDNQEPTKIPSSRQGLDVEIVNEFGQLMGEYSKLDDGLWLSSTVEGVQEPLAVSNEDLQLKNTSSQNVTDLEPWLKNSDMSSVSIVMNDSQNNVQASSPVSVLKRKSDSNVTRKAVKLSRSKRRRSAKGKPHCRYSASEGGQSTSPDSLLLDEVADSCSDKQVRTRKMSDLLQLHSVQRNQNPNLASTQPLNLNREPAKACMHCDSSSTPQWRDGPMGPKTLCNACGIQFKSGRLTADYRPLRSPSFNPSMHTNVTKTKKKEMSKNSFNSGPSAKRNQEMKLMDHSKMYQDYSPKAKTTRGMIEEIGDLLESGSRLCTDSPKIKRMKLDNSTVENQYPTHQQKEQERRNSSDFEMSWNCAPKATAQEITEKPGELFEQGSGFRNGNLTPKQILGKKLPKQVARKCLHCESTKTPQWRPGPMGRNTLCNACGVQYKNGRLFPEYRPLKSPTYDPSVHSHLPKKVLEMRMSSNLEKCAISGDSEQPVSSNSFTHLFRVH